MNNGWAPLTKVETAPLPTPDVTPKDFFFEHSFPTMYLPKLRLRILASADTGRRIDAPDNGVAAWFWDHRRYIAPSVLEEALLLWPIVFVIAVFSSPAVYLVVKAAKKRTARKRALAEPFPDAWVAILDKNLPFISKLPTELREELKQQVQVFLAEKSFEGCGGLTVTDEIKVTIAGQACLLLLNRQASCYPKLHSIVVYPHTYVAKTGDGTESVRLGESWHAGLVVLAWDSVKQGARNFRDGHNVTMHEFAHQLDQEDGASDGAPILEGRSAYSSWASVLSKEFLALQKRVRKHRRSVLDAYGATNHAEFFAVATESFFEEPKTLQRKHAELYDELRDYYKVDPADWS